MFHDIVTDNNKPQCDSQLIVSLATQALHNLPHYKKQYPLGKEAFQIEFGTVKIFSPRRSGHSTAALQLMYEYPDSLLFVHNIAAKDYMRELLSKYITDEAEYHRISQCIHVVGTLGLIALKPVWDRSFIIFDQTTMMKPSMIELVTNEVNAQIRVELQ